MAALSGCTAEKAWLRLWTAAYRPIFCTKKAALYQKDCTYCRQTKDRKTLSVLQQQVLVKEIRTAGFSAVHIKGGI